MQFDKRALESLFTNVVPLSGVTPSPLLNYSVQDAEGNAIARLTFFFGTYWEIEIENTPNGVANYSSTLPCRSVAEFVNDVARVGVELIPR